MQPSVLLVRPPQLGYAGLRGALQEQPDVGQLHEVVIDGGGRSYRVVQEAAAARPDLILVDPGPDTSGVVELVGELRTVCAESRLVVLGEERDPHTHLALARLGVAAHLPWRSLRAGDLRCVLALVHGTDLVVGSRRGVDRLLAAVPPCGEAGNDKIPTPRQREVLRLVAEGMSTKAIALRLGIESGTVEYHLGGLFERLGTRSRAAAVHRAWQHGWLP